MSEQNYPRPINDPRLTPDLVRCRSGVMQHFKHRNERGLQDKHYHIKLEPPEKHIYAELIDGVWYWVNGCAECNGKPRNWMTYIECDKHNRCAHCGCSREELPVAPWGRRDGWVCKPCADIEHEKEKAKALSAFDEEEYDEWDYRSIDNVKCPYCNCELESSEFYQAEDEEVECPRCDNEFKVTAEPRVEFTMQRIGDID